MRRYFYVSLILTGLLAGCFGGDIDKVKTSRMKGWSDYSVGQLLEKRNVCGKTKWHSFVDTRDRKVIEYICEYSPAQKYLHEKTEKELDDIKINRELRLLGEAKSIEDKRKALDAAIAFHEDQLAKGNDPEKTGLNAVRALENDRNIIFGFKQCAEIKPENFTSPIIKTEARRLMLGCTTQQSAATLDSLKYFVQSRLTTEQRAHENIIRDLPRSLMNSEGQVRVLKQDLEMTIARSEKDAQKPDIFLKNETWLKARLASFKGVNEISQWTMVDGQPTYLGSRVDLVFANQTVEVPVEAAFVFSQAKDNSSEVTALYGYLLNNMLREFKQP